MNYRESILITLLRFVALLAFLSGCSVTGPVEQGISPEFEAERISDTIGDQTTISFQTGTAGPTVVFMHGIPSSSYLWRNVLPVVGESAKAVAVDLPGYGESSIPSNGDYSYQGLYAPLEAWLDNRPEEQFILVVNDLGSVLGIDYAVRHPGRISGIVLIEAVFMPARPWYLQLTRKQKLMFWMMRSDTIADTMIVSKPRLEAMVWGMGAVRKLSADEKAVYLKPYADIERRRVVREGPGPATFPQSGISVIEGDMAAMMNSNAEALAALDVPILLLTGDPGFITRQPAIDYARQTFSDLLIVNVGAGKHYLPEDQPTAIGLAIRNWVATLAAVSEG